jgi:hypothetical protein
MNCIKPDCGQPVKSLGMCQRHYHRYWKHRPRATPLDTVIDEKSRRFAAMVLLGISPAEIAALGEEIQRLTERQTQLRLPRAYRRRAA